MGIEIGLTFYKHGRRIMDEYELIIGKNSLNLDGYMFYHH